MSILECKLQLIDLYFSKFDFVQERENNSENTEYTTSLNINYSINQNDTSKIKIVIDTNIKTKDENICVNLQTVGIFDIDKDDMEIEMYEQIIKGNTVAIMFPYIRSQISLITTQPGIAPIMIPPINVNALIETTPLTNEEQ